MFSSLQRSTPSGLTSQLSRFPLTFTIKSVRLANLACSRNVFTKKQALTQERSLWLISDFTRTFHSTKSLRHGNHGHDHHDHHGIHLSESDKEQDKQETNIASKITALGLLSNVVLGISKAIAGAAGNSAALIADAAHSFSDLASDIVTLAAVRYARKPPTELYPKGFAKFESVGAFAVGGILMATAIGIAEHSLEHNGA